MENRDFEKLINKEYSSLKNNFFSGRYFPYLQIETGLKKLSETFNLKIEGYSVQQRPIYSVEFGKGTTKVLMWSQMHGNESTTTKAVFDLFNLMETQSSFSSKILNHCNIKIIPVLNPDGTEVYTRENHNNIDLNRDALNLSQPESRVLDEIFKKFHPDFCFNLHDQRSIYSAGEKKQPATISFLAPSADEDKSFTSSRKKAMKLIASLTDFLQNYIPGKIGRYDDAFNLNCVGDKFQANKVPTILFEAGHFPGDYQREETRRFVFLSLAKTLLDICEKKYLSVDFEEYFKIPENKKLFYDIIVRNVAHDDQLFDLGIQYEEKLNRNKLEFNPIVKRIGDLSSFFGHREIKEKDKNKPLSIPFIPNIDTKADYITLNGNVVLLKLSKS